MPDAAPPWEWCRELAKERLTPAELWKPYVYRGTGEDIYGGEVGYLEDVRRPAAGRPR